MLLEGRKFDFYQSYPEIEKIDKQIASVFQSAMKKMLNGEKVDFKIAEEESLALQKQKADLIEKNGIDVSVLTPNFKCKKCEDTGYSNGVLCDCVRKKAVSINYDELNKDVRLEDYTFDKFEIDCYPEICDDVNARDIMTKVRDFCVKYSAEFKQDSQSLLFFGKTGLGKTHLSLAIANSVIEKGYNVVYGPISRIIGGIEREHFSNNERTTLNNIINCDLLILDDLGTEFTTQFVVSSIFDIINSRILNKKPTIINTNLGFDELKQKYSDRVVSRISKDYRMLQFFGKDNRI